MNTIVFGGGGARRPQHGLERLQGGLRAWPARRPHRPGGPPGRRRRRRGRRPRDPLARAPGRSRSWTPNASARTRSPRPCAGLERRRRAPTSAIWASCSPGGRADPRDPHRHGRAPRLRRAARSCWTRACGSRRSCTCRSRPQLLKARASAAAGRWTARPWSRSRPRARWSCSPASARTASGCCATSTS